MFLPVRLLSNRALLHSAGMRNFLGSIVELVARLIAGAALQDARNDFQYFRWQDDGNFEFLETILSKVIFFLRVEKI